MKTSTKHKLTQSQVKRLSQIVNVRKEHLAGMALLALERKGLVNKRPSWDTQKTNDRTHIATLEGVKALHQARAEGY